MVQHLTAMTHQPENSRVLLQVEGEWVGVVIAEKQASLGLNFTHYESAGPESE